MPARAFVALLALGLALVPAAHVTGQSGGQAASSEVTFYGHIFGHGYGAPMPSNTEAPVGEAIYGFGEYDACTPAGSGGLWGAAPGTTCEGDAFNKLVLFSTAGFVDVEDRTEFLQEGAYSLLHNERGQTKDIHLDTSKSITASIFLTVDFHAWTTSNAYGTSCALPHPPDVPCFYPYWGWDVGVQPGFTVDATLYKAQLGEHGANASSAPPIQEAISSGDAEVVAQGQWGPDTAMNGFPGAPNVMEFAVDMGQPQVDTIPKGEDFFIVYSFNSEAGGQGVGVPSWRIWSGEFFPPTYTLPVENAFDVERVIPSFAHGKMAILGVMNTPWGSYDIDPESVDLSIQGPRGEVSPDHLSRFGKFSVAHGGHYLPINITWIWDYRQEGIAPGTYEISLSAQNFQGSAAGSCTATVTIREDAGGQLTPGATEEGVCGLQSASEAYLQDVQEGAEGAP